MGPDTTRGWLVANSKPLLCSQAVTTKSFRKALDGKNGDRLSSGTQERSWAVALLLMIAISTITVPKISVSTSQKQ
jgi:hypothetical protein